MSETFRTTWLTLCVLIGVCMSVLLHVKQVGLSYRRPSGDEPLEARLLAVRADDRQVREVVAHYLAGHPLNRLTCDRVHFLHDLVDRTDLAAEQLLPANPRGDGARVF